MHTYMRITRILKLIVYETSKHANDGPRLNGVKENISVHFLHARTSFFASKISR